MSGSDRIFKWLSGGILLLFVLSVAGLLAADAAYVDGKSLLAVFSEDYVLNALILSFVTSVIATLLALLVGIPSAYVLSRSEFRGRALADTVVDLLIVMPVLVIGISLLVVFRVGGDLTQSSLGLLRTVGNVINAVGDFFIYTRAGVVLAQFFCAVSYVIRTIKTSFDEIDSRTEQVAMTLGCTLWCAFRRITLPLARHGIIAGAMMGWLRAFGVFGAVIIVGGAVRNRTEVLPTAIYLEISIGRLEAAITISLLMVLVATVMLTGLRWGLGTGISGKKG